MTVGCSCLTDGEMFGIEPRAGWDNYPGLQRAHGPVHDSGLSLQLGPGTYEISAPLKFIAPVDGANPEKTKIVPGKKFDGMMLLDFGQHSTYLSLWCRNIGFDSRQRDISHFGSTSAGGGGGNSGALIGMSTS